MGQPIPGGVVVTVKVVPRASKPGIAAAADGSLRVRLQSPPVDGAANAELIAVLASAFGLPKRAVSIVAGAQARTKRVKLEGIDAAAAAAAIARAAE